jgi:hypothetical protein
MMTKCPDCNFVGNVGEFIHNTNPPPGNSGCWCPKCDLSVEIINGQAEHYIDAASIKIAKDFLTHNKFAN